MWVKEIAKEKLDREGVVMLVWGATTLGAFILGFLAGKGVI